jgi:16S rRNA pseudouridine516 synthase
MLPQQLARLIFTLPSHSSPAMRVVARGVLSCSRRGVHRHAAAASAAPDARSAGRPGAAAVPAVSVDAAGPLMRVDAILSQAGLCSRRGARAFLRSSVVTAASAAGGSAALRTGRTRVRASSLTVDGEPLSLAAALPAGVPPPGGALLTVALHKPAGAVCSHAAAEGDTVYDLLPPALCARLPRLQAVGRLDRGATGLLLLTQCGALNAALCAPARAVAKEYVVALAAPLSASGVEAAALASGALRLVDGAVAAPAALAPHATDGRLARVTLREGRHHQLRRMFAALGHRVTAIHRAAFAGLRLADLGLPPGAWRVLTPEELAAVRAACAAPPQQAPPQAQRRQRQQGPRARSRPAAAHARLRWGGAADDA